MADALDANDKLEYYDLLGIFVPGVIFVTSSCVLFPDLSRIKTEMGGNEVITTTALFAVAILAGFAIHGLGDLIETRLYRKWGGRPSQRVFTEGLEDHFLRSDAERIGEKLRTEKETLKDKDHCQSIFLRAMALAEGSGDKKSSRFNAIYHCHRSILVLIVLVLILYAWSHWSFLWNQRRSVSTWCIPIGFLLLLVLFWHLTKLRGWFFVRQVLLTAERLHDEPKDPLQVSLSVS